MQNTGIRGRLSVFIFVVIISGNAVAESDRPVPTGTISESSPYTQQASKKHQPAKEDNRGTEAFPLVVKIQSSPDTGSDAKDTKAKDDKPIFPK